MRTKKRKTPTISRADSFAAAFDELLGALGINEGDLARYYDDPVGFALDVLKVSTLTEEQKRVMRSVVEQPETNVQAGHGVGKTFLAAILVLWWVFCRKGLCITTAPTKRQVNELLWSEVRKMYDRHRDRLGGHRTMTTLHLTEDARAYGFTATDTSADGFQGVHAGLLLAIQDEASGITEQIDDGFSSCIAGEGNRGLRIGNPVAEGTPFHGHCLRGGKATIRIPVFSHPNVAWAYERCPDGEYRLKPDVAARLPRNEQGDIAAEALWPAELPRSVIKGAVSIYWIEKKRREKGEGSTYWRTRVMGEFPESSLNALVPRKWFMEARARYDRDPAHWDAIAAKHPRVHGLDIGDGNDPHALVTRRGPVLLAAREIPTIGDRQDTERAIGIGLELFREDPDCTIAVDRNGVGAGVASALIAHEEQIQPDPKRAPVRRKPNVVPVNNGEGATDSEMFENVRAEDFWGLRELFEKQEIAIAPLGEETEQTLRDELAAIQHTTNRRGRIVLEAKEKIIARIKRSPNLADGAAMAFRPTKRPGQTTICLTL